MGIESSLMAGKCTLFNVGMIIIREFTIINPNVWRPKFWPILNFN